VRGSYRTVRPLVWNIEASPTQRRAANITETVTESNPACSKAEVKRSAAWYAGSDRQQTQRTTFVQRWQEAGVGSQVRNHISHEADVATTRPPAVSSAPNSELFLSLICVGLSFTGLQSKMTPCRLAAAWAFISASLLFGGFLHPS